MSRKLAELLIKERIITPGQFSEADAAAAQGKDHVRFLIEKGYVAETKLLYYLSQKFGMPSINLQKFEIPPEVAGKVPVDLVRKCEAIPIQAKPGVLVVAICDPTKVALLEDIKFRLKVNVEAVLTTYSAFDTAIAKRFGGVANVAAAVESYAKEEEKKKKDDKIDIEIEIAQVHDIGDDSGQEGPVISLVNGLLTEAISRGASDIHVEPYEKSFRVRLRIDGSLVQIAEIPLQMKRAVIARFKIMSRMDISEARVPQDGRIKIKARGSEIDFRVSSLPTIFGEKIVLRILSKGNLKLDLTTLGFEQKQLSVFRRGVMSPHGMVLVTGPTGSGKTTTLYSALMELNQITDNVSTAEDPVEYNLEGINQVQINKDVGLTFASVLRSLLRQDPDAILVGEIRDFETAEIAIQAALTGHLVLSTLHTNDAPGTVQRMMNMGVEPFLITASVNTIVAQRLLRRVCEKCKASQPIPVDKLVDLGINREAAEKMKCMYGKGCKVCNNSGYKGRVAIYEVMEFSQNLKEMVLAGVTAIELKKQAVKEGMTTLRMSGLSKVAEGLTSLEEAVVLTSDH